MIGLMQGVKQQQYIATSAAGEGSLPVTNFMSAEPQPMTLRVIFFWPAGFNDTPQLSLLLIE